MRSTPTPPKSLCWYDLLTQLAEYAHEKTGYFYDESLHKEVKQRLKSKFKRASSSNEPLGSNNFLGFDYCAHDEERMEEDEELWAHSHTVEINIVLISHNPALVRGKLEEIWPPSSPSTPSLEKRQLDLFVHTIPYEAQHIHCYKFWILDAEESGNPIYGSYLNRAKKILKIGSGGPGWIPEHDAKAILFECVSSLLE